MRQFKRAREEPRGDEFDRWGTSTWYFEVGDDRYPSRQVEVYAANPRSAVRGSSAPPAPRPASAPRTA